MSWWKQVLCELAPQQQQHITAVCNNTSNNGVLADMNGTNGNCSCHKQRHCNRLTCYRNGNSSGSNHPKALPLFIIVAVLMLAMTPINAAVMKRSIVETTTNLNSTTPNTPLATTEENDSTTANTPLLAINQTTVENVQHATGSNEPETTTVSSSTVRHDDQMMHLVAPLDANNEIAQVVSEEAATDFQVKANPKFDYVETVLDGNLEDSIRNSVRNEIEYEQDIVAAEVEHLQNVTDEEVRQKLGDEVLLIQSALHESSTKSIAAVDVLAELTSTTPETVRDQLSTTDRTFGHSKIVKNDLSVLFPLQTEETVSASESFTDNQRGARNLNIIGNENQEILNDNSESNVQIGNENQEILNDNSESNVHFNEDSGMQNIEGDKVETQDDSLDAEKSSLQILSRISESALYSHEANEIDEERSTLQKVAIGIQEHQHKEEDTKLEYKNTSSSTEKHFVSSEENNLSNERSHPSAVVSAESHEAKPSDASNENVDTTLDRLGVQDEIAAVETTEKYSSPAVPNETDEASLSIVLDENISATEATTTALAESLPIDLLHLDDDDALADQEAPSTVEPEHEKSVHVVIKKQGVELDEDVFVSAPAEPVEATTAIADIVKEKMFENEEITAKPTVTLVNDIDIEKEQIIQNDDAKNETSLQLDDKVEDQTVSEPTEPINEQVIAANAQMNNEDDKLSEDNNQIDTENVEGSGQVEQELEIISNPTISEEITHDDKQDVLNDKQYLEEINNDIGSRTEKSTATQHVQSARVETPTEESAITQEVEAEDNEIVRVSSTTESMIPQEIEDNENNSSSSTTERSGQMHFSLLNTTHLPNPENTHTPTDTIEKQSTTLRELEVIDEDDNNTDDPDIVPLLVGVSSGQGDVTTSTKGSRSINTQTHHTMLLTQLDDTMAATLFETFPPHNAGRTLNDHMAAESSGGIGKPLPTRSINEATSASIFSRSGLIIVVCSSIAFMFLLVSVVAFLISFQRQHGTLDIEMQEQRCGKDDLDEEDEEAGTCTKLLDIELPKSTIVSVSCEELEECL